MNLLLLSQNQLQQDHAVIDDARRIAHIQQHLKLQAGDDIKVGLRGDLKGKAQVQSISEQSLTLANIVLDQIPPAKLPLTLVVALPRPKVLRRLVMDAVTQGVEKLILIHSYRVEKSYWQTPFLDLLDHYVELGLEQAGDTVPPTIELYKRFRPFVEDVLPLELAAKQAWLAHPYTEQKMPAGLNQPSVLVIGPEGGFIPFEVSLLQQNGCQVGQVGERILRTETAITSIIGRLFTA
jgi:RsmE family RNA methyltransferase